MNFCSSIHTQLSDYLDSRLSGVQMHRLAAHLEQCSSCAQEWNDLQRTHSALSALSPMPPPTELLLRIRVAIAHERERTRQGVLVPWIRAWNLAWKNTIGPFVFQASAGFASAVLLIGTVALMVGMFAQPEQAQAADEPLGMATGPHFRYLASGTTTSQLKIAGPVVIEASVNSHGEVYDYRIVSGPNDPATRSQVEYLLLFSVFEPAHYFGKPVHGLAIVSFSGVSVRG